jgi:hypothetical protein
LTSTEVYFTVLQSNLQAFFISTQEKQAQNLTTYSMEQISTIASAANISSVHVIDGTDVYHETFKDVFQIGLSIAHLRAWEAILSDGLDAAWVFEDDIVFHKKFNGLLQSYWQLVPADFEVVYLGMCPPWYGNNEKALACKLGSPAMLHPGFVQCTHALVVSRRGAARLSQAMNGLLKLALAAERKPDVSEIRIDNFLNYVGRTFLPAHQRHRWIVFDTPHDKLSEWGDFKWCEPPEFEYLEYEHDLRFCCEKCSETQRQTLQNLTATPIPLRGSGLVFQNLCKLDPWKLENWRSKDKKIA